METLEIENTGNKKLGPGKAIAFMTTGIIGAVLLIVLLLPNLDSERIGPCRASCARNLKQINLALRMYSQENKGQYPDKNGAEGFEMLRAGGYLDNSLIYTCPSKYRVEANDGEKLTEENVGYVYIGGYNEGTSPNTAIVYDKLTNNHHGHGNILFANGHVEGFTGPNWMDNIKKK